MNHPVSTKHLQHCKNNKSQIAEKILETISHTYSTKSQLINLKKNDFWQSYFATKLPKKKLIYFVVIQSITQNWKTVSHLTK